ncbi:hypothetical protein BLA60_03420 [Actinophytocola xinjiangensis]|uniref:Uncharacterized protein n=1 Tax=Actinophytocola xinjiangensis TaxID=485602 RepID=A0A7Z0WSW3_9PSEU|nr:hypothetical protein BLA60_03420 [Actinophytocola xinjiangensis]
MVPTLLRGAAGSVEECRQQIESGRRTGAAAGVGSGMAGFTVAGACEAAGTASESAFSGVARSWQAWADAAASGATAYTRSDESGESLLRGAVV